MWGLGNPPLPHSFVSRILQLGVPSKEGLRQLEFIRDWNNTTRDLLAQFEKWTSYKSKAECMWENENNINVPYNPPSLNKESEMDGLHDSILLYTQNLISSIDVPGFVLSNYDILTVLTGAALGTFIVKTINAPSSEKYDYNTQNSYNNISADYWIIQEYLDSIVNYTQSHPINLMVNMFNSFRVNLGSNPVGLHITAPEDAERNCLELLSPYTIASWHLSVPTAGDTLVPAHSDFWKEVRKKYNYDEANEQTGNEWPLHHTPITSERGFGLYWKNLRLANMSSYSDKRAMCVHVLYHLQPRMERWYIHQTRTTGDTPNLTPLRALSPSVEADNNDVLYNDNVLNSNDVLDTSDHSSQDEGFYETYYRQLHEYMYARDYYLKNYLN